MKNIMIKSSLYDYEVIFIQEVRQELQKLMNESCTFVIDRNIYDLYRNDFTNIPESNIFLIDAIEKKKNMNTILELIAFWQERKVKKNWKVLCFGGGITQDITTFASNIYLRNIEWYFFPTTLLAMSDSCIGGKCGINLGEYKNQLGVFYPPRKIFICDKYLETLSEADYINGWGEILKFSLTEDAGFYEKLSQEKQYIPCEKINEYIYRGLNVKKHVIEADEFEGDLRRILNYGHTFGHALEAYTYNAVPHGKAVIWGMDVVNYISWRKGMLDRESYDRIKNLIYQSFIREEIQVQDTERFMSILSTDKKVKGNTVFLVLLERIGHLTIVPMELGDELEGLLEGYLEETHVYYCH